MLLVWFEKRIFGIKFGFDLCLNDLNVSYWLNIGKCKF